MEDRSNVLANEPGEGADPNGLDAFYRAQAPRLLARLRTRLRSEEEARDVVQDAFVRLVDFSWTHALREPGAALNRIVRNLLIDRSRRLANKVRHVPIEEHHEPSVAPDQSYGIEVEQMRERYRAAVAALPPRTRQVFLMHRADGIQMKEIAERLDISVRTVEWHVAEAIVRIGDALERE
jgi:RNA polymerase sigma-70 factor (ECF subfamily)